MPREVELKLRVPPANMAQLRRLEALLREGETITRPSRQRLVSVYFDTPDHRLRDLGISLRVRQAGRRCIQTVKADASPGAGLSDRHEVEASVPAAFPDLARVPDAALRETLLGACDGAPLQAVFSTEVERTVRTVTAGEDAAIEVALDRGVVRAGRRSVPVSEIELELKQGPPASLFDFARRLAAAVPVELEAETKSARGFRLLERRSPQPVRAGQIALPPDATVEQAFQSIARNCIAHLAGNSPGVLERHDPEGIHQMRVALRRFRSALRIFRDLVSSEAGTAMEAHAKELGALLGAARDLDVFEADVFTPVMRAFPDDSAAFRALLVPFRRERAAAYRRAVAFLRSPDYVQFLLEAGAWIEGRQWARSTDSHQQAALAAPAGDFARAWLGDAFRKLRKKGRHLAELEPEARHDVRKRLKRLRYGAEFLLPLVAADGQESKKAIKRMGRLQDALGVLNDGKMARARLQQTGNRTMSPAQSWAAGLIVGWHSCAADDQLENAVILWKRFTKTKGVLACLKADRR